MLQRWQHMALALRCRSCLLVLQEHLAACSRLPSRSAIMFLLHGVVLVDPTAQTTTPSAALAPRAARPCARLPGPGGLRFSPQT